MYNQKLPVPTPYAFPTGMMPMSPMAPMTPMAPTASMTPMAPMPMSMPMPMATPGPGTPPSVPGVGVPGFAAPSGLPMEQSFIENILRLNLGKVGTFYMTYENNSQWNAKIFKGKVEAAGRDHIIISDPQTGQRLLLLMVNLDYVTFDEPLNYSYPLQPQPR